MFDVLRSAPCCDRSRYIPDEFLSPWVRAALAPATAIAAMNFLGLLHPPAGAAALIFATAPPALQSIKFMYLVFPLLVGNILSIIMATLINNLNKKREYPLYWSISGPLNPW